MEREGNASIWHTVDSAPRSLDQGQLPGRLPPGNTPNEGVYPSGGEEGSAQETNTETSTTGRVTCLSPVDRATCCPL